MLKNFFFTGNIVELTTKYYKIEAGQKKESNTRIFSCEGGCIHSGVEFPKQ